MLNPRPPNCLAVRPFCTALLAILLGWGFTFPSAFSAQAPAANATPAAVTVVLED